MKPKRRGLSLVEIMVVIAIIGLLLSLLLPAVQKIREGARRTKCSNNVRQIGLALHSWSAANGDRLPASWRKIYDDSGAPQSVPSTWLFRNSFSWRTTILPFIEHQTLHDSFDYDLHPLHPTNHQGLSEVIPLFQCPTTPGALRSYPAIDVSGGYPGVPLNASVGAADYEHVHFVSKETTEPGTIAHDNAEPGAWFGIGTWNVRSQDAQPPTHERRGARGPASLSWIRDGLSNTALVIEKAGNRINLPDPDAETDVFGVGGAWALGELGGIAKQPINESKFSGMYSFHPGGAQVLMCDGSVCFLADEVTPNVVVELCGRSDGDSVR